MQPHWDFFGEQTIAGCQGRAAALLDARHPLWAKGGKGGSPKCTPCWGCSSVTPGAALWAWQWRYTHFLCVYLSILFGLGINKERIHVTVLLRYCDLSLRTGKLPEICVPNRSLFPPRPKQLKAHHFIASCSTIIPVHSFKTALKPFKQSQCPQCRKPKDCGNDWDVLLLLQICQTHLINVWNVMISTW